MLRSIKIGHRVPGVSQYLPATLGTADDAGTRIYFVVGRACDLERCRRLASYSHRDLRSRRTMS